MLYAETATFQTLFAEKMLTEDGFFKDLTASGFTSVKIDAGAIVTGTLTADRILLRGGLDEDGNPIGLLLALNNIGELVSENVDSLDGYVLTNNSVHADKIIANSITAKQIQAESISGTEIAANSIKTSHISTLGLDAGAIKTGTLDAALVAISNLSAGSIKTGLLESLNGAFFLDMESGDFNLGDAIVKQGGKVTIKVGGVGIEDYIEGKVPYSIYVSPSQFAFPTDSDGKLMRQVQVSADVSVFEGTSQKAATLSGALLRDSNNAPITNTGIAFQLTNPTEGTSGLITLVLSANVPLPTDSGTLEFLIAVSETGKRYTYKATWTKAKAGSEPYTISIYATNGNTFKNGIFETELKAKVLKGSVDITDEMPAYKFKWERISDDPFADVEWNNDHLEGGKTILITGSDVYGRATFNCSVLN